MCETIARLKEIKSLCQATIATNVSKTHRFLHTFNM